MKKYEIITYNQLDRNENIHTESILTKGYTIIEGYLPHDKCDTYIAKLKQIYEIQKKSITSENLKKN